MRHIRNPNPSSLSKWLCEQVNLWSYYLHNFFSLINSWKLLDLVAYNTKKLDSQMWSDFYFFCDWVCANEFLIVLVRFVSPGVLLFCLYVVAINTTHTHTWLPSAVQINWLPIISRVNKISQQYGIHRMPKALNGAVSRTPCTL